MIKVISRKKAVSITFLDNLFAAAFIFSILDSILSYIAAPRRHRLSSGNEIEGNGRE